MSDDAIIIRDSVKEDQVYLAKMMLELNKFEQKISPDRNINPDAGAKHLTYAQDVVDKQGGFTLVAESGGQNVGFIIGCIEETEGHYIDPAKRRHGYIHDLFVSQTHRGMGLAKQLLSEAEIRFKDFGLTRMELFVLDGNENAVSLYKNQGFEVHELCMSKKI